MKARTVLRVAGLSLGAAAGLLGQEPFDFDYSIDLEQGFLEIQMDSAPGFYHILRSSEDLSLFTPNQLLLGGEAITQVVQSFDPSLRRLFFLGVFGFSRKQNRLFRLSAEKCRQKRSPSPCLGGGGVSKTKGKKIGFLRQKSVFLVKAGGGSAY